MATTTQIDFIADERLTGDTYRDRIADYVYRRYGLRYGIEIYTEVTP